METFAPGDRVVAINTMPAPLYPDSESSQRPYLLPDGPLRQDVVYHVADTVMRPSGRQGVFLTGLRVTWGLEEIPWASSRFRKVDTLRDCASKQRCRKQPVAAASLVTSKPKLHSLPAPV
jgi:hypothetical protein